MPTITLPEAGKATTATIRRWRVHLGDSIHKGQAILEIETDEGLALVESPIEGRLDRILADQGQTLPIHSPVADVGQIGAPGKEQAANPPAEKEAKVSHKPPPSGNVVPILMPKAGQTMEEGTLIKWHVQPGTTVQKGQVIFEIETDKAAMDVEATHTGRLARIVVAEGQTVPVMTPVAYLADSDADVEAFIAAQTVGATAPGESCAHQEQPVTQVAAPTAQLQPPCASERRKASPAARRIAAQRGIDLSAIAQGSGPGGRILSTDVPATAVRPAAPAAEPSVPAITTACGEGVSRRKMSSMRKAIAGNLSLSKQTIPHFYIRTTVNAEPLLSFYQSEKAKYPCTINDVVVQACARAIREFPSFRCRVEGDEIVQFDAVNIGIAVGMDDGLVVPVLVNADRLTLQQIGAETKRLSSAARAGRLEGLGKGLFTVSNMGMLGVEEFAAIINPPEAAILAVGTVREDVIVSGGTLRPGKVMTLTLSVDHRIIDGTVAARFLNRLKELLEWPAQMVG